MSDQKEKSNLGAILTGIAALITAIVGVVTFFKPPTPSPPTPSPSISNSPTGKDDATSHSPVKPEKKFTIVGTWLVYEPNVENPLTSITLSQDNQYQGGSWGKDFGGSSNWDSSSNKGLGANQYSFDGEALSFNHSDRNILPVEAPIKLTGNVKVITPTEIEFTVTGGFYGDGKNLGKVFKLKK